MDVGSALVTPGLVDAHTHPVFAGDRSDEAAARLAGEPYTGGGILRTVAATRAASDDELEALVDEPTDSCSCAPARPRSRPSPAMGFPRRRSCATCGSSAAWPPACRSAWSATFLGAHARPPDSPGYVDEIVGAMLPAVAAEGLAGFCDVFCDAGFFTVEEAERILRAALAAGLETRLHADQLQRIGATALAVRLGATSADHLEQLDEEGVRLLAGSPTVATLLPGPALVMRDRLPPARALLDAGATVALASDANAGTFGSWGAMPLVIGLGSTLLGMTAGEAVRAATVGGAAALRTGWRARPAGSRRGCRPGGLGCRP